MLEASRRDYLADHIREVPMFRALLRAVECRLFEQARGLPEPVLDLGCGDGHFASVAFARPLLVGIDLDAAVVAKARERGGHRHALVASATRMPFPPAFFASVVANCVVEHIPDIDAVLAETARVLRPGGRLVFGVPSEHFAGMLLGPAILRGLRLPRAARAYGDWFNAHSRHYHTDAPGVWRERLARHGFDVDHHEYYIGERAHRLFDLLHYASVPQLVHFRITGRWTLFPNPASQWLLDRWLRRHYDAPPPARGAYLFFHATRRRAAGGTAGGTADAEAAQAAGSHDAPARSVRAG